MPPSDGYRIDVLINTKPYFVNVILTGGSGFLCGFYVKQARNRQPNYSIICGS
jgi:arginine exporter protein ArgO